MPSSAVCHPSRSCASRSTGTRRGRRNVSTWVSEFAKSRKDRTERSGCSKTGAFSAAADCSDSHRRAEQLRRYGCAVMRTPSRVVVDDVDEPTLAISIAEEAGTRRRALDHPSVLLELLDRGSED